MRYAVIDIETTGLNRFKDEITFIGVELHKDIKQKGKKTFIYDYSKPEDRRKFANLVKKMKERHVKTVFQNGKFDTLFIEVKMGIKLPIHEDVMLMGTVYDLADKHGLKYMAQKYLHVEDWDIKNKDKLSGSYETVVPYLKCDLKYTWELFEFFSIRLNEQQEHLYRGLLIKAFRMYRDVERNGIYIDLDQFQTTKQEYKRKEAETLKALKDRYDINWNSPQQKQDVLFSKDKENLPVLKLTPKRQPSADASVMKRLAGKGYELPQLILDYSAVNTLNKMFLNRWEDDAAYDGRIHPSFNLTNVVSGRTSCTDPNLQQVPRNKDIRSLFTAPEGRLFFEADYSQLELRIAAHYSNDPTMLRIYNEGGDIHTMTASLMTGGRTPTKEERSKAKAVNFGFLYGMSAKKFVEYAYDSYGQTFSNVEAEAYRDAFFAKYSRLLPWHKEQEELCEMLGGVTTLFGRFRKLPKIYSDNKYEHLEAARRAVNTPVQGTGSDILLSAAVEVHKRLSPYGLKICGTVHDSILGEFNAEDEGWIVDEIKAIMAHPRILDDFGIELKVGLEADVGVGPWGSK
jgi:DNA polymerase-1